MAIRPAAALSRSRPKPAIPSASGRTGQDRNDPGHVGAGSRVDAVILRAAWGISHGHMAARETCGVGLALAVSSAVFDARTDYRCRITASVRSGARVLFAPFQRISV